MELELSLQPAGGGSPEAPAAHSLGGGAWACELCLLTRACGGCGFSTTFLCFQCFDAFLAWPPLKSWLQLNTVPVFVCEDSGLFLSESECLQG